MTNREQTNGAAPVSRLSADLRGNADAIADRLGNPADLNIKRFTLGERGILCALLYMDGLSDTEMLARQVIRPLQQAGPLCEEEDLLETLETRLLSAPIGGRTDELVQIGDVLLGGQAVLLLNGLAQAIVIAGKRKLERNIDEPQTEALVRGPRIGFTEDISTNLTLLRRMIRDPNLIVHVEVVGRRSKQELAILYIQDIAHPGIVEEALRRVRAIDVDTLQESGSVEQWIEDSFLSPFPQLLHTERPDKVSAFLLKGKVAILLDGTPFALLLPITFLALIQSPEDYYERWLIGTLLRLLRYSAVLISLFLPALYIALVSYHQGMIPFKLAFSIAASREGVPFPSVIEALLMEATLELLREAGVRLPKPVGQTVGIVGGLVIGEAAVRAGIVSPIMVIVVAVTAISSFTIPAYSAGIAFRMLRFATMLAAGLLGLYGIVLVVIMISVHLLRLSSFGIPYTAPFAPSLKGDWLDLFIRAPVSLLTRRPQYMQTKDKRRANVKGRRR